MKSWFTWASFTNKWCLDWMAVCGFSKWN